MPCSFCGSTKHNLSKCIDLALNRAISIYNDDVDMRPRNCDRNIPEDWYLDRTTSCKPNQAEWRYPGRYRLKPITNETVQHLSTIRGLRNDSESIDKQVGYTIIQDLQENRIFKLTMIDNKVTRITITENIAEINGEYRRVRNEFIRERGEARRAARLAQQNAELQRRSQQQVRVRQEQMRREEEALNNLVSRDTVIEASECGICMDTLKETNRMILRCGHQFCGDCIFRHFQGRGGCSCPQCRSEYALRVSGWVPPGSNSNVNNSQQRNVVRANPNRELINRMANMESMFLNFVEAFRGEN